MPTYEESVAYRERNERRLTWFTRIAWGAALAVVAAFLLAGCGDDTDPPAADQCQLEGSGDAGAPDSGADCRQQEAKQKTSQQARTK